MDPALRLLAGTVLIVAIGWAPFACSGGRALSPTTRDAAVKIALEEFRYQCVTNPPVDARLQAACLVVLDSTSGSAKTDADTSPAPEPIPSASTPGDAGASFDPTPGNAVRYVER